MFRDFLAGCKRITGIAGWLSILAGSLLVSNWAMSGESLSGTNLRLDTALGFVLAGAALLSLQKRDEAVRWRYSGIIAATIIFLLGAITVFEIFEVFGHSLGTQ